MNNVSIKTNVVAERKQMIEVFISNYKLSSIRTQKMNDLIELSLMLANNNLKMAFHLLSKCSKLEIKDISTIEEFNKTEVEIQNMSHYEVIMMILNKVAMLELKRSCFEKLPDKFQGLLYSGLKYVEELKIDYILYPGRALYLLRNYIQIQLK